MESIGDALQKANLSQYITPLLDIGADDSEQLASLPEPDFQSLLEMTGMSKKPFHVLRFKKAINRLGPPVDGGGPTGLMGNEAVGESSTHTVTVYATQIDEPGSIAGPLQRPSPVVPQPMQLQSSGASGNLSSYSQTGNSNSLFELMTRPGVPNSSRLSLISKDQLQALVDDTVPVQQQLGPSPISPTIWDKGRLEIFRKASIIFSSSISPLTDQEQLLNEAALQLCLWDPTLLVRQKDLIQLAKKLIKQYFSIVPESEHPVYSAIEPKTDLSWSLSPTSPRQLLSVNRGPDGKFRNCFEENYERREFQIQQVELLIGENTSKEKMKQALLLQAKEKMDYSLALKIQEELSVLGKTQREYKTELSRLRKVQRRSVRHQEMKKVKKSKTFEENPTTDFHPNSTQVAMTTEPSETYRHSSQESNSINSIPVTMKTDGGVRLAPGDGIPLQLHTYIHESVPGTTSMHSYSTGSNPVLSVSSSKCSHESK